MNPSYTYLAGSTVSLESMPLAMQEQLLAAASGLIVNRSGLSDINSTAPTNRMPLKGAPILRVDRPRAQVPVAHQATDLVKSSQQLRKSIQSIRDSLRQIESHVQDRIFDSNQTIASIQQKVRVEPPRKPSASNASIQSSIQSLANRWDAAAPAKPLPNRDQSHRPSKPTKGSSDFSKSETANESVNRPRIWRRWVRLDRILESQAARWQSQAARLGVRILFKFEAPTGQEVWTDVDIILHIVDQFVAAMLSNSLRGSSISIHVGIHPEDEHWMQIAVRGLEQNRGSATTRSNNPAVFTVARKFATMIGGFLDQYAGNESNICWKFHFPVDDILSWLRRASMAEHSHVVEVELLASHAEALDTKHWMFADRAFQAGMDLRDRAIMIAPKRYLLTSADPFTDISSLRRRFQLQLDRIGASLLAGESQTFDLRCQNLGSLDNILKRIFDRIQSVSSRPNTDQTRSSRPAPTRPNMNSSGIRSNVHDSHKTTPRPKLRNDSERQGEFASRKP